jgi:hypothetical protein
VAFAIGAGAPIFVAMDAPAADTRKEPARDASSDGPDSAVSRAASPDASSDASPDGSISRIPPDPPPMRERTQWVFDLRWDRGDVYLLGVHKLELPAPQETPRAMGRFAIELFEGPTLIERVRFDFPLLGDEARDGGIREVPYFGKKLTSRIGVMFPATSRGTRLSLWDRATDRRWDLPWPPTDTRLLPEDGGTDVPGSR